MTVTSYFEAANEFLRVQPWTALPPDNCVAARVDGGTWCYVSVMGQNVGPDHHPGISMFDSWQAYESLVASPAPELDPGVVSEIGGLEGVTFQPVWSLHPRDAYHLIEARLVRPGPKEVFLPHRYEGDGMRVPKRSLAEITTILEGIAERFSGRWASRGRPNVGRPAAPQPGANLVLEYPCRGPMGGNRGE
ncbi:MAG: hypothetical protein HYT80_02430 [Euryarchaeota archaeon]|nr:hypothetical protein [Euryarchaeota archaeon]